MKSPVLLNTDYIENIRIADSKMHGYELHSYIAEMTVKYCEDNSRSMETVKTGNYIQLLYYPPYHSKYNPIKRCRGIPEKHWNGTKLTDAETMLKWAGSMTWKGIHHIVKINKKRYKKGISLTKAAMRSVKKFLVRNPDLPKCDIPLPEKFWI